MKKLILILLCCLSICALSAKEQTIIIKTKGGVERPALKKGGEPYIGFSNIHLKQEDNGNISLECSEDGWDPCEIDPLCVKVKCAYEDLLKLALSRIRDGENNGKSTDKITKGKKKFSRSVKWNSTGLTKSSKIVIILNDEK